MSTEKKSGLWPATVVIVLGIGVPLTIGSVELRIARNAHAETAAIEQLQTIAKAEDQYRRSNGSFSPQLDDLKGLPKPESFYRYSYRPTAPGAYVVTAAPVDPNRHGRRSFYMDQSGVVRYELAREAGPTSSPVPPIGQK